MHGETVKFAKRYCGTLDRLQPRLLQHRDVIIEHNKAKFRARARSEPGGTRWRTGREVKGKLANGIGSQYSQATSERGISIITKVDAYTSAASSRLNWRPHRFKWTRPFRGKKNSGFCACAITFRTSYNNRNGTSCGAKVGKFPSTLPALSNLSQVISVSFYW